MEAMMLGVRGKVDGNSDTYFTLDTTMNNSTFFTDSCSQADVPTLAAGLGCDVEPTRVDSALNLDNDDLTNYGGYDQFSQAGYITAGAIINHPMKLEETEKTSSGDDKYVSVSDFTFHAGSTIW
jgi:hypothetical protein